MVIGLTDAGDLATAESFCAAALAGCRDDGDLSSGPMLLMLMADLDVQAARFQDAAAHLREGLHAAMRAGDWMNVLNNGLGCCALLCTATGRYAEAATVFAAETIHTQDQGAPEDDALGGARRRDEALSKTRQALGPDRARTAEQRGAAMSADTAAEYALMLTAPGPALSAAAAGPGLGKLSARERGLYPGPQGRTNPQIAAQLYISVHTVGSHLDRIRDKTGCRRRADLTRLAATAGLV